MKTGVAVFVSHPFDSALYAQGLEDFRQKVKLSLTNALRLADVDEQQVDLKVYFQSSDFGSSLPGQIRNEMRQADFAIVDLTGARPNVMHELGFLMGIETPVIVLAEVSTSDIPADIRDILVGFYRSIDELLEAVTVQSAEKISDAVSRKGQKSQTRITDQRCFWFEETVSRVHIVCAPEVEKSRFAYPDDVNFLFIDNLEDRDALLYISMFLSRSFPEADIIRNVSDLIQPDVLSENLVIIGGPGDEQGGNNICTDLMSAINSRVSYSPDCEQMIIGGHDTQVAAMTANGRILRDWGCFARFQNPFNPKTAVVMCHGMHTAGTLGACLAFSDEPHAMENRRLLERMFISRDNSSETLNFDAVFPVNVVAGSRAQCPSIRDEDIAWLNL